MVARFYELGENKCEINNSLQWHVSVASILRLNERYNDKNINNHQKMKT